MHLLVCRLMIRNYKGSTPIFNRTGVQQMHPLIIYIYLESSKKCAPVLLTFEVLVSSNENVPVLLTFENMASIYEFSIGKYTVKCN